MKYYIITELAFSAWKLHITFNFVLYLLIKNILKLIYKIACERFWPSEHALKI